MIIVPENFAQVVHSFTMTGDVDPYAITYGVEVADPPVVATSPTELAQFLHENFCTNVMPEFGSVLTLNQTEIRWQTAPQPAPPTIGLYANGCPGTNPGAVLVAPPNTALLVHKRTNLGGRKGRGRLYMPAVAEAWVDNVGIVVPATRNSIQAAFNAYLADLIALPDFVSMVVFHDDASATADPPPAVVQTFTVDNVVATQRRRLRK